MIPENNSGFSLEISSVNNQKFHVLSSGLGHWQQSGNLKLLRLLCRIFVQNQAIFTEKNPVAKEHICELIQIRHHYSSIPGHPYPEIEKIQQFLFEHEIEEIKVPERNIKVSRNDYRQVIQDNKLQLNPDLYKNSKIHTEEYSLLVTYKNKETFVINADKLSWNYRYSKIRIKSLIRSIILQNARHFFSFGSEKNAIFSKIHKTQFSEEIKSVMVKELEINSISTVIEGFKYFESYRTLAAEISKIKKKYKKTLKLNKSLKKLSIKQAPVKINEVERGVFLDELKERFQSILSRYEEERKYPVIVQRHSLRDFCALYAELDRKQQKLSFGRKICGMIETIAQSIRIRYQKNRFAIEEVETILKTKAGLT